MTQLIGIRLDLLPRDLLNLIEFDHFETFSLVAKLTSIWSILSLAANFNWPLYQLNVKNAFLHGELREKVYMDLPPEFMVKEQENKVCFPKKSLYGLKQSPRAWFERFNRAVI